MVGTKQAESLRRKSDSTDDDIETKSSAMTSLEPRQSADKHVLPPTITPTDAEGDVEIETEDASVSEVDVAPRVASRSPDTTRDFGSSASLYAPSRFPRRLDTRPRFTVIGDSIMEEESIDLAASTRSLVEQYLDYNEENGRRYCSTYYMPNDDFEQTRLYLSHQVYLHMLDGEPTTVPLTDPKLILDIGTGTGDWAIHIGEKFPACEVIGTDISAMQSTCPPYNVFFEIENAEDPWLRQPDSVDLVHMRHLAGAFRDWRFIYEQTFECLRPGGWIEVQEFNDEKNWKYLIEDFPEDAPIRRLARDFTLAGIKAGRPYGVAHLDTKYLHEAGFVDVNVRDFEIPISTSTGSAGRIWLMTVVDGLEASCLRPLTKYMGWDPDETKRCCELSAHMIAKYAKDPEKAKNLAIKVRIVTARKPDVPIGWDGDDMYLQNDIYMQTEGAGASAEQISLFTTDTRTSVPGERTPVESIADYEDDDETPTQDSMPDGAGDNGEVNGAGMSGRRTTITAADAMDLDDRPKSTVR